MPTLTPPPADATPARRPMPPGFKAALAVFASIFLVSLAALAFLAASPRGTSTPAALVPDEPVRGLAMPEFTATTQAGDTFSRADLLGHVTIADFMFTHCPFICPVLTARMKQMSEQLAGTPVRFVSMSVDPARDTPARLAAYAAEHAADTARWSFLSTDEATVRRVVGEALKFELSTDPKTNIPLPDGTSMPNIVHPGHFVLLGPDAQVLGIYRASDAEKVAALVARARDAATALPAPRGH